MNIICCLALLCCCFCLFHNAPVQGKRVAEQKCQETIDEINYVENIFSHVGGVAAIEAKVGEFSHQALLTKFNNDSNNPYSYCGGSLISKRFVLTAAHCGRPFAVRLGDHNPTKKTYGIHYFVFNYIKHPKYRLRQAYFDIALVELWGEIRLFSGIRPACLWTSDPLNYTTVVATGYGATKFGSISKVLMKVPLDVINRTICEDKFFGYWKLDEGIKDDQLCVGSEEGGNDTCDGDSGGPIQVVSDVHKAPVYYVVGIVSTGYACGIGMTASVYTKVASYVDWIEEIVWPDEWKESQNPVGSAHQFPTQN